MSVSHPSTVEISPAVVDRSHATCRTLPDAATADGCATPTDSDRVAWLAREFPEASPMHRDARARFLAKVGVVADSSSCWPWAAGAVGGKRGQGGYGAFAVAAGPRFRMVGAHRVAHEIATGVAVAPDLVLLHACDNPRCVRPSHLSTGTQADNVRDSVAKGRRYCKLTDDVVRAIAASDEPADVLADRFEVTKAYIGSIRSGRARPHVARPVASVEPRPAFVPPAGMDRNAAIVAARIYGDTLQVIGDRYGITRERVRQIVAKAATP